MAGGLTLRPQTFGAGYAVKLPVFEGPLDLLLQLIESQALDISAVSLVAVTDSYVQTIGQLEEIEPGSLADFLVVASRLLYIKSYYLLPKPRPQVEEEDEEASGDALIRQLLEYRRFKEVASHLRSREEQGLRAYVRVAPRPELPRRLEISGVDAQRLQAALRKVLQRLPVDPPLPRVKTYAITVAEQIENVRTYLVARRRLGQRGIGFVELLSRGATRLEVVVTFLAILELVKLGEFEVDQADTFGEIILLPVERAAGAGAEAAEVMGTNSENPVES
ncbi:MAG: segregation/condensation protein A [Anaerolineales bacterium]|nr:segregation/condensation protein A [Anaerolineales bacterium]